MFSRQLIDYTESTFKESKIEILTKTMVKEVSITFFLRFGPLNHCFQVKEQSVVLQMPDKTVTEVPCGVVVWAAVGPFQSSTKSIL
jgi:NADH:ubiquinone reductase (non-electrogenic)